MIFDQEEQAISQAESDNEHDEKANQAQTETEILETEAEKMFQENTNKEKMW